MHAPHQMTIKIQMQHKGRTPCTWQKCIVEQSRTITVILIALNVAHVVRVVIIFKRESAHDGDGEHDTVVVVLSVVLPSLGHHTDAFRRRPIRKPQGLQIVQRRSAAMEPNARERHRTPESCGLKAGRHADEGDGVPRRPRRRSDVHKEKLVVVIARHGGRACLVRRRADQTAHSSGTWSTATCGGRCGGPGAPPPSRRRSRRSRAPRAEARRVRARHLVLVLVVVGGLLGAPAVGVAAAD
jgi:hypothetical protein